MKNIFLYIVFFLGINYIHAQLVVQDYKPLESFPNNTQDGDYYKDVNNLLNPYVGNWIGVFNGNTIEFEIIKEENVDGIRVKWDRLLIKYKVISSIGEVIVSTLNDTPKMKNHIEGLHFGDNPQQYLAFYEEPFPDDCSKSGNVALSLVSSTELSMWVFTRAIGGIVGDCPDGTPFLFPTSSEEAIILTKQ